MEKVKILAAGEQGLVIEFGEAIDFEINARVHRTARLIKSKFGEEVIEVVPTYRSLMVYFDPLRIQRAELVQNIKGLALAATAGDEKKDAGKVVIDIPVFYGGELGPDLSFVASHNGLTEEEVIAIHTATPYLVYMIGFTPGFPYLGGMSEKIATPRLAQPRTKIPAGSVGIAGSQTGFYPIESPGGWQLIGRTPVKAFNACSQSPFLFEAGDYLRFVSVSQAEYDKIAAQVEAGEYKPATSVLGGGV